VSLWAELSLTAFLSLSRPITEISRSIHRLMKRAGWRRLRSDSTSLSSLLVSLDPLQNSSWNVQLPLGTTTGSPYSSSWKLKSRLSLRPKGVNSHLPLIKLLQFPVRNQPRIALELKMIINYSLLNRLPLAGMEFGHFPGSNHRFLLKLVNTPLPSTFLLKKWMDSSLKAELCFLLIYIMHTHVRNFSDIKSLVSL